jgi:hypothetical protein
VLFDAIVAQKWLSSDVVGRLDYALHRLSRYQRPIAAALPAELDSQWANGLQVEVNRALEELTNSAGAEIPGRPAPGTYGAASGPIEPPRYAATRPWFDLWEILSYYPSYPAARIESMRAVPAGLPSVALDSQCPVTFAHERVWKCGDHRFGAVHRGHLYFFTSRENQDRFLADPDRYCPVDSGYDVVQVIENREDHPGRPAFALVYDDRIYLFENMDSQAKFAANSARYAIVVPGVSANRTETVGAAAPPRDRTSGRNADAPARR